MHIERSHRAAAERPYEAGFVGDVRIAGYFRRERPSKLPGATVSFGRAARTPWKTNPLGQTVVVLSGVGWVQSEDGPIVEVRAGDVIWWSPGERHWEGATCDEAMTYFAIQEEDLTVVSFGEAVGDEQYSGSQP